MNKVWHDSEIPAVGQQVITACAFIWHDFAGNKKVFMPKRADTKQFLPGIYELPGGHIDFGEDIAAGLRREIQEELRMTLSLGEPFAAFTYHNEIKGSHSIEVVYFARFNEPISQVTIQLEDHSEYAWFSRQEVIDNRQTIVADAAAGGDVEYRLILRGFELLDSRKLNLS